MCALASHLSCEMMLVIFFAFRGHGRAMSCERMSRVARNGEIARAIFTGFLYFTCVHGRRRVCRVCKDNASTTLGDHIQ